MNIGIILSENIDKLRMVTNVIMILLIVLIIAIFGAVFYYYSKYYTKCIKNKLEDETIKDTLIKENIKYFKTTEEVVNDEHLNSKDKFKVVKEFKPKVKVESENSIKVKRVFSGIIYGLLLVIIFGLLALKLNNKTIFINDKAYISILSDSMQGVYSGNKYIEENNLTNQFPKNSLIEIEKVKEEDLKLYDVVAFINPSGEIIVHRITFISNVDGVNKYTTRGDANNGSISYERNFEYDIIIGRYTGRSSVALGILTRYTTSNIGIIILFMIVVLLILFDFFYKKQSIFINIRKNAITHLINEEIKSAIENNKKINFIKK